MSPCSTWGFLRLFTSPHLIGLFFLACMPEDYQRARRGYNDDLKLGWGGRAHLCRHPGRFCLPCPAAPFPYFQTDRWTDRLAGRPSKHAETCGTEIMSRIAQALSPAKFRGEIWTQSGIEKFQRNKTFGNFVKFTLNATDYISKRVLLRLERKVAARGWGWGDLIFHHLNGWKASFIHSVQFIHFLNLTYSTRFNLHLS